MPLGTEAPVEGNERAPFVSIRGAIVHSLSWTQGSSEDIILRNPFFALSEESPIEYSIYCIHGTADRSYAFGSMMSALLAQVEGLPKCVSKIHLVAFNGRFQGSSIDSFAEQLKYKIIQNRDLHVILAGHSRGGLVASKFAQFMAKLIGIYAHAVMGFSSPWNGSPWAIAPLAAVSTSVAQMRADSDFLKELRQSIASSEEESRKYFYFGAAEDSLVPMEESFVKEAAHSVFLLKDEGHLSIMNCPEIVGYVSDCLHRITSRPVTKGIEKSPIEAAGLEIEAAIYDLSNRYHVYSSAPKLKILADLKRHLECLTDEHRGDLFPEAETIGDFISMYLDTTDASTGLSLRDIIAYQLNVSFFSTTPSRTIASLDGIIGYYKSYRLPNVSDQAPQFNWDMI